MRKAILLSGLSLFLHPRAFAYCQPLPRLICAEYSTSGAVVTATLLRTQHFTPQHKQDWFIYTLEATKILKGKIDNTFRVYEENSSGRAPFTWEKGEAYLLFLNPRDDGAWWIYGCGNSRPLRESGLTLKVIESLQGHLGGLIQGLVRKGNTGDPIRDVVVEILGRERSYKTVTNQEGKFGLHVPAGHYKVQIVRTGWSSKRDDLESFEDPGDVEIENSSCAQVVIRVDLTP